jgi:hypothetical protein
VILPDDMLARVIMRVKGTGYEGPSFAVVDESCCGDSVGYPFYQLVFLAERTITHEDLLRRKDDITLRGI